LWFGRLLQWRHDPDAGGAGEWWAVHDARQVRLVHLDAAAARAAGSERGWYLRRHPDDRRPDVMAGPGPRLGGSVSAARQMAEVWTVTDPPARQPADGAPSLLAAAAGVGAACATPAGTALVVHPDHAAGRFLVRLDRGPDLAGRLRRPVVGVVVPRFDVPANPDLYPVAVSWLPAPVDPATGQLRLGLPEAGGWHAAVHALGTALDQTPRQLVNELEARRGGTPQ
jgi:hypothetical protein